MTLGQKIREVRLERKMTQREVVGDHITRNMLSKIENDSAVPSVRTLEYIASSLGLPAGYFMSDLPETRLVFSSGVSRARKLFADGDYAGCVLLIEDDSFDPVGEEDEFALLCALSYLRLAQEYYDRGQTDQAKNYAQKAIKYNADGLYVLDYIEARARLILLQCMSVTGEEGFDAAARLYRMSAENATRYSYYRLLHAQNLLRQEDPEQAKELMSEVSSDLLDSCGLLLLAHLKAQLFMQKKEWRKALEELLSVNDYVTACSDEMLMVTFYGALETCYRELGDYKMAYTYATKRLECLQ